MCTYTVYSVVLVFRKHKSKTPLSEPSNNDAFPMAIPLTISLFWTTSPSLAVKGIKHIWCVFSSLELYKTPSQWSGLENKGNKIDLELCVCVHGCTSVHMCRYICAFGSTSGVTPEDFSTQFLRQFVWGLHLSQAGWPESCGWSLFSAFPVVGLQAHTTVNTSHVSTGAWTQVFLRVWHVFTSWAISQSLILNLN